MKLERTTKAELQDAGEHICVEIENLLAYMKQNVQDGDDWSESWKANFADLLFTLQHAIDGYNRD